MNPKMGRLSLTISYRRAGPTSDVVPTRRGGAQTETGTSHLPILQTVPCLHVANSVVEIELATTGRPQHNLAIVTLRQCDVVLMPAATCGRYIDSTFQNRAGER